MKTYEIAPVLCRGSLLTHPDDILLSRFLEDWRKYIAGITIRFRQVGEDLFVMGRPRLIDTAGNLISVFDQRLPFDLSKDARYFLMMLIDDEGLSTHLENIDVQCLLMPSDGEYALSFFPGCAIFSIDNPAWFASEKIRAEGYKTELMALRAPTCTILLNDAQSAHVAMEQPALVENALGVWRKMTGMHQASVGDVALRLALPDHQKISDCTIDEVAP